jgi:hypothetical protein
MQNEERERQTGRRSVISHLSFFIVDLAGFTYADSNLQTHVGGPAVSDGAGVR